MYLNSNYHAACTKGLSNQILAKLDKILRKYGKIDFYLNFYTREPAKNRIKFFWKASIV